MRCEFEHDDGAYVLGALSPAERAAYEGHLANCPACREAVAEIAVLPGLLGRLDLADLEKFGTVTPPPERQRLPELIGAAQLERRRERRRRRWAYVGAGLAAACLALVVGVGTTVWLGGDPQPRPSLVAMQPVGEKTWPVTAEVALRSTEWGTEVTMHCAYGPTTATDKAWPFRLVAHGPNGETEQINSWKAAPDEEVTLEGTTRFSRAELKRLELLRFDGVPLLAYDVH